jgi:hypothetical protein
MCIIYLALYIYCMHYLHIINSIRKFYGKEKDSKLFIKEGSVNQDIIIIKITSPMFTFCLRNSIPMFIFI